MRISTSLNLKQNALRKVHSIYEVARLKGLNNDYIQEEITKVLSELREHKAPQWVTLAVREVSSALLTELYRRDLESCYEVDGKLYSTHKFTTFYLPIKELRDLSVLKDKSCNYYWSHIALKFS